MIDAPKHPAPFNLDVLVAIGTLLDPRPMLILDPFAGIGRVNLLYFYGGHTTVANELEFEWAYQATECGNLGTVGDATALPYRSGAFDAVVTSPVYGNRMSDHHEARDDSRRITYRHYMGRPLHPNNAGQMQWGKAYRQLHSDAWAECWRVLKPGGQFILNIKDHIRDKERQAVVAWHQQAACWIGFKVEQVKLIPVKGRREGENNEARVPVEHVIVFRKVLSAT